MKYIKTFEHTIETPDKYPFVGDYIILSNEQGYYLLYIINSNKIEDYSND